jgi:hypothetical protein
MGTNVPFEKFQVFDFLNPWHLSKFSQNEIWREEIFKTLAVPATCCSHHQNITPNKLIFENGWLLTNSPVRFGF